RHCKYPFVVMISENLSETTVELLKQNKVEYFVEKTNSLFKSDIIERLKASKTQSHWANTFFKLQVFGLTNYKKIVYIDSDMLVLDNIDELFEHPHLFAVSDDDFVAGRDEGILGFNSGTLVIEPKSGLVQELIARIPQVAVIRKQFGDQDVLNLFY